MEYLMNYLQGLVQKGGPDKEDYGKLTAWADKVVEYKKKKMIGSEELSRINDIWGDAASMETIQGFALKRPYGYPGDFELLEKIYNKHLSPRRELVKWDEYIHFHKASEALRNRKKYFINVIMAHVNKKFIVNVLNLGSGPGRDMYDLFNSRDLGRKILLFDCVDHDLRAIHYANRLCRAYLDHITFINENILFFVPDKPYDVIWAGGVFDYFSDRIFRRVLQRLAGAVKKNGEIVIGNFSVNNPARNYMEMFGWTLHHRSQQQLNELALSCGIDQHDITIGSEETGINLFLHITQK
ncbi:MAG: class I SAM-dependent methyltransferase [Spirochaetales bacterium]|nr:class I SAM-dependent methyltransferase [Spirochaetales bacterium]